MTTEIKNGIDMGAFALNVTAELDWTALGKLFASATSDDQGRFLEGMVTEFGRQPHHGEMQFAYIAVDLEREAPMIAERAAAMLASLAGHLEGVRTPAVAA